MIFGTHDADGNLIYYHKKTLFNVEIFVQEFSVFLVKKTKGTMVWRDSRNGCNLTLSPKTQLFFGHL
jgi:hypothetical protein